MEQWERLQRKQWTPREVGWAVGIVAGALFVLIGVFTSFYTVAPEEEAVVLRFGEYSATTGSGLHFKLPFGLDEAIKVPVTEVRTEEFGFRTLEAGVRSRHSKQEDESIMLTGDLNIADVEWVVQYRIKDARDWVFHVLHQEDTIRDISEAVTRSVVGDYTVTEVLTSEKKQIADEARKDLQERLDYYRMGVQIVTVELQDVTAPAEVQDSFNDVNAAEQERSRTENEAQREYNKIIQVAEGNAKRTVSQAEGYAVDRVNRAKGNVARFKEMLKAYQESKEVTRRRLYLEALEAVLPKVERILVVDSEGVLKLLPLEGGAPR
jgi:membrane protease subunit HflK